MTRLSKSLKLTRQFILTLNCPKSILITALKHNVDAPGFEPLEQYKSGSTFKGTVTNSEFHLRRRREIWTNKFDEVNLNGVVTEDNGKTVIQVEAEAVHGYFVAVFGVFFVLIMIIGSFSDDNAWIAAIVTLVFIVANTWMMGRSVYDAEHNLGKELNFIVEDYKRRLVDATGNRVYQS